jgi:hypothetical protein
MVTFQRVFSASSDDIRLWNAADTGEFSAAVAALLAVTVQGKARGRMQFKIVDCL